MKKLELNDEFKEMAAHYYHCWLQARKSLSDNAILEFRFARYDFIEFGEAHGFNGGKVNLWFKANREDYVPEKADYDKFLGDLYAASERAKN